MILEREMASPTPFPLFTTRAHPRIYLGLSRHTARSLCRLSWLVFSVFVCFFGVAPPLLIAPPPPRPPTRFCAASPDMQIHRRGSPLYDVSSLPSPSLPGCTVCRHLPLPAAPNEHSPSLVARRCLGFYGVSMSRPKRRKTCD